MVEQFCIVISTTNSIKVAKQIINILLNRKLVACIQKEKIRSYFLWNGSVSEEMEYRLTIKALNCHYNDIEKLIVSYHNYQVPEIIKLKIIDGYTPYFEWIKENTK